MKTTTELQNDLLKWYDQHRRAMPWRAEKGQQPDAYNVWLSEIMLQQTTVTAVKPYFEKFVMRFPTVFDLAHSELDEVLQMWAGLGYYARARNLHKCANVIVADYGGQFPADYKALLKLPGVGPYTAAAVASIAFGLDHTAVDGNVERVVSRLFAIETPLPDAKPVLKGKAENLGIGNPRPSDFTQAFMELGATICTPKSPKCFSCPWQDSCEACKLGIVSELPRRRHKKPKPKRQGRIYILKNDHDEILLYKRPEKGLLGGMIVFPSMGWDKTEQNDVVKNAQIDPEPIGQVHHVFTHFSLSLSVYEGLYRGELSKDDYMWVEEQKIHHQALPSLMRKVAKLAGL